MKAIWCRLRARYDFNNQPSEMPIHNVEIVFKLLDNLKCGRHVIDEDIVKDMVEIINEIIVKMGLSCWIQILPKAQDKLADII